MGVGDIINNSNNYYIITTIIIIIFNDSNISPASPSRPQAAQSQEPSSPSKGGHLPILSLLLPAFLGPTCGPRSAHRLSSSTPVSHPWC